MSLLNDLGLSECEFKNVGQRLREEMVRRGSKLRELDILTGLESFRRDGKRLDERNRAGYRQLGLDVSSDPEDEIVQGNKITNINSWPMVLAMATLAAVGGYALSQMNKPDPVVPQPPPVVQPTPPPVQVPTSPDNVTRVIPGFGVPETVEQRAFQRAPDTRIP